METTLGRCGLQTGIYSPLTVSSLIDYLRRKFFENLQELLRLNNGFNRNLFEVHSNNQNSFENRNLPKLEGATNTTRKEISAFFAISSSYS